MESVPRQSAEPARPVSTGQLVATLARAAVEIGLMLALLPVAVLANAIAARPRRPHDSEAGGPP